MGRKALFLSWARCSGTQEVRTHLFNVKNIWQLVKSPVSRIAPMSPNLPESIHARVCGAAKSHAPIHAMGSPRQCARAKMALRNSRK
jgi:hypothetical protein